MTEFKLARGEAGGKEDRQVCFFLSDKSEPRKKQI